MLRHLEAHEARKPAFAREAIRKEERLFRNAGERPKAQADSLNLVGIVSRRFFTGDFDDAYCDGEFMHRI